MWATSQASLTCGDTVPRMVRESMRTGQPSGDTRDRPKARPACLTDTSACSGYENARAGNDAGVQRIRQVGQGMEGENLSVAAVRPRSRFELCIEGSHHAPQIDSAGRKLITRHRSVNRCAREFSCRCAGWSEPARARDQASRRQDPCRCARPACCVTRASEQRRGFARDYGVRMQASRRVIRRVAPRRAEAS